MTSGEFQREMKSRSKRVRLIIRWFVSLLLGIFVIGCGFYFYSTVVLRNVADSPWPVQALTMIIFIIPLSCFALYLVSRIFLVHSNGEVPVKGFRQWSIICGLGLSYGLYLVFIAFVFEFLFPSMSLFYRGIFIPLMIGLVTILILTRTMLSQRFERFLKGLFKNSDE